MDELKYLNGLGNYFQTEAKLGSLPIGQNSPQKPAFGLYAERLSGSAFTVPRSHNLHTWLYRIRPSVVHGQFTPMATISNHFHQFHKMAPTPNQLRWNPIPFPDKPTDFIHGLIPWAGHGDGETMGAGIYLYACNQSMIDSYFFSADGEFLFVPQKGVLLIHTELGKLLVAPGEIAVVPRGIKFQVEITEKEARGYALENYGQPLQLPDLGPIGANGLANARDFQIPVASFQDQDKSGLLITKVAGQFWQAQVKHHVFDVVAWHGNYVPYKYNLKRFNTINTVSYDHPDPSIFTVLTSPSGQPGVANIDFVIFPDRWMVAENTFRPPYYHRNIMSEFMGLIHGRYDAKEEGFTPGGSSLHNAMSAHGPDYDAFNKATQSDLTPKYYSGSLAFMFESRLLWRPTAHAMQSPTLQADYQQCWQGLKRQF